MKALRLAAITALIAAVHTHPAPAQQTPATAAPAARARTAGKAPSTPSYERWVKPRPLDGTERAALRTVQRWAKRRGTEMRVDNRLMHAARALLGRAPRQPGEALDTAVATREARRRGWTDGQLAAIAIRMPRGQGRIIDTLRDQLDAQSGGFDVNRVGVAVAIQNDEVLAICLLARRLVQLWPVPSRLRRGSGFTLAGSLPAKLYGKQTPGLTLALSHPDGRVERRPVHVDQHTFTATLPGASEPGVLTAQLLVDRGRGPEVAAVVPIGIERSPFEAGPVNEPIPRDGEAEEADDPEGYLAGMVLDSREVQDLGLPAQSIQLTDVARAHARDMREHSFFAHVSPTTGAVTDRLQQRGVRYVRALENIAVAETVEDVFRSWMQSPSHRANILDPSVTAFGLGIEEEDAEAAGRRYYVVLVLAKID